MWIHGNSSKKPMSGLRTDEPKGQVSPCSSDRGKRNSCGRSVHPLSILRTREPAVSYIHQALTRLGTIWIKCRKNTGWIDSSHSQSDSTRRSITSYRQSSRSSVARAVVASTMNPSSHLVVESTCRDHHTPPIYRFLCCLQMH